MYNNFLFKNARCNYLKSYSVLILKLPTIKIENELAIRFPVGKHHNLTLFIV